MKNKVFCINCNGFKNVIIRERISECKVRNKSFSYIEKYALCADCMKEVYMAEINDRNAENRLRAFCDNYTLENIERK